MTLRSRIVRVRDTADSGSALILSLLVVLTVGTGLAIALDYTGQGLTLAPAVRNERNVTNFAQGAVEGAINQVRGSSTAGQSGKACPDFAPTAPPELGLSGKPVLVTCEGKSTGSGGSVDQPLYAIHALGTGTQGIRHVGTAELYVDGGIFSKGVVDVAKNGGSLRVNGTIEAAGGCTSGNITSTDPLDSACAPGPSPAGDDPAFTSALPNASALTTLIGGLPLTTGADPLPSCAITGRVTFSPGYYSESPATKAARLPNSCNATLWHFSPGTYYFDYPGLWDIGNQKVVGGTLSTTPTVLGQACLESSPGVQFIFGGTSRVSTNSSTAGAYGLEVCGPSTTDVFPGMPQRIALYGVTSGAAPAAATAVLRAATGPASSAGFALPDPARIINGLSTPAVFVGSTNPQLEYGLLPSTGLPKGARVSDVRLRVNHSVTDADAHVTLSSSATTPATTMTVPLNGSCGAAPTYCTSSNLANSFSGDVLWRHLSQLSATYTVVKDGKKAAPTASVDGLELVVTYTAPALTKLDCGSSCTFLTSTNNPNVFFHGTVYTPTSDWAVKVHNNGDTIFNRGIVMRDIAIDMSSSSKQETSPFQLPAATPTGRLVLFRGYIGGQEKVRACARYVDFVRSSTGSTSAYAGWSLTVPRWSVLRSGSPNAPSCT